MTAAVLGARLREKPWRYWLVSAVIFLVVLAAKPLIEERLKLDDLKNFLFVTLVRSPTNPATAHEVKLIAIGDDAYWGPELQHRAPTNRSYLARLIRAADAADASVIALDFDLRAADPDHRIKPGDYGVIDPVYRAETDALMRAVGAVAARRRIVLAKRMEGPVDGPFALKADVYQAYGLCNDLQPDGRWRNPGTPEFPLTPAARRNISCGYIALMDDSRRVPPPARLVGRRERLDAFPLAIARARNPASVARFEQRDYVASYVPEALIDNPHVTIDASRLLADPAAAGEELQGYPVIIGAAWHEEGPGQGERTDLHDTPIGPVVGALIHVNLAEAVLSNRTYPALSEGAMLVVEVMLGTGAALLFALAGSPLVALALLAAAMPLLFGIQWLSLQLFGTFLDLLIPVIGLGLHAVLDRIVEGTGHGGGAHAH